MSIATEHAVHTIAKALWVDHGNNPDNWVYRPPEDLAHYFQKARIAYDAVSDDLNTKVQELAKRLLDEDITDSLDVLDKLATGELKLI